MNLATFAFIFTGILLNAAAQLFLKTGTNAVGAIHLTLDNWLPTSIKLLSQLPILGGLACYAISVVVWIIGLSRVEVSIAYPMLSLGYIVNAIGAWWLLGEPLSGQKLLAVVIILLGVVLLARS